MFGHTATHPAPQPRTVGLVDKEQQAAARRVGPVEELVDLGDRGPAKRRDVAARENGVVHARVAREVLGEHRLARAGRAVQHHVAVRSSVITKTPEAEQSKHKGQRLKTQAPC